MYSWETLYIYCQQGSRWFEPLSRYQPTSEHLSAFRDLAPPDWTVWRRGLWFIVDPPGKSMPKQGWKLHVSSRATDSVDVLRAAIPRLVALGVPFKFLLDPRSVALTGGKLWPRGSSGKFITVYPPDEDSFRTVATDLAATLSDYSGPYILSDRRVPESRNVFYRYGGFTGIRRVRPDGAADLMIAAPDGELIQDVRQPYWHAPAWIERDPFGRPVDDDDDDDSDGALAGRFTVTDAIQFSNRGGVYIADDAETGDEVILKEVRPNIGLGQLQYTQDYVSILHKEHRLLTALADSPHYVNARALFEEWEHTFLAEDRVDGPQLSQLSIEGNPVYTKDLTASALAEYHGRMRRYFVELAHAVGDAHERNIVLCDLSWTNVLVDEDRDRITIIDLEAARDLAVDPPMRLHTKGISSPRYIRSGEAEPRDDLYSIGAMLFGSIMLANTFLGYRADALPRFLNSFATDLGVPDGLVSLIRDLTDDPDGHGQPAPAEIARRLSEVPLDDPAAWPSPIPLARPAADVVTGERLDAVRVEAVEVRDGIVDYLKGTATPDRDDRLFPGDVATFETNPHHLAHGAAGVLHALHVLPGDVPRDLDGWLLRATIGNATHPAGLYYGQAGIAWVLDELGHSGYASTMVRRAAVHPARDRSPGILRGAAGVGLACLRLWHTTGDEIHLHDAVDIGRSLAESAVVGDNGAHWNDVDPFGESHVPLGYGNGPAGVALFLLYLHLATGAPEPLTLGRAALDFELAHAVEHSEMLTTFRADLDEERAPKLRAYFDEGTAGVLTTLIRYVAATGDPDLEKWVDRLLPDISRKYAVMPQLFHGLAGFGNALLDAAELLDRPDALAEAWRTAEGVLLYRIDAPEGIAYPGEQSLRESADLASGAAGVGLFLDRLIRLDAGERPGNHNFVLDELLRGPSGVGGAEK